MDDCIYWTGIFSLLNSCRYWALFLLFLLKHLSSSGYASFHVRGAAGSLDYSFGFFWNLWFSPRLGTTNLCTISTVHISLRLRRWSRHRSTCSNNLILRKPIRITGTSINAGHGACITTCYAADAITTHWLPEATSRWRWHGVCCGHGRLVEVGLSLLILLSHRWGRKRWSSSDASTNLFRRGFLCELFKLLQSIWRTQRRRGNFRSSRFLMKFVDRTFQKSGLHRCFPIQWRSLRRPWGNFFVCFICWQLCFRLHRSTRLGNWSLLGLNWWRWLLSSKAFGVGSLWRWRRRLGQFLLFDGVVQRFFTSDVGHSSLL